MDKILLLQSKIQQFEEAFFVHLMQLSGLMLPLIIGVLMQTLLPDEQKDSESSESLGCSLNSDNFPSIPEQRTTQKQQTNAKQQNSCI